MIKRTTSGSFAVTREISIGPLWLWVAPVLGAMLIALVAFSVIRVAERRSQATAPASVALPVRTVVGVDKGSFLPTARSGAMEDNGAARAEDVTASQVLFLREAAKKEAGEWKSLGEPERAQQRAALKAAMLGEP